MIKPIIYLAIISFAPSCHAKQEEPKTLCASDEKPIFNCQTPKKIASICVSPNVSKLSGYAQYRFGTSEKIELEFPRERTPPSLNFSISSTPTPGGSETIVEFKNNSYIYSIQEKSGHPGNTGMGFESSTQINVKKNGKFISKVSCTNADSGLKSEAYDIFKRDDD
ncbi:hypothetical protein [[Pseudomonas] boreopolis]|uniref:hypothetical protein n=1 Tax=Xanthomonas boreopolis TaxID=86183 RepID=UPI003D9B5F97